MNNVTSLLDRFSKLLKKGIDKAKMLCYTSNNKADSLGYRCVKAWYD